MLQSPSEQNSTAKKLDFNYLDGSQGNKKEIGAGLENRESLSKIEPDGSGYQELSENA